MENLLLISPFIVWGVIIVGVFYIGMKIFKRRKRENKSN